jgi:protein O-GlcNAc transferase
LLQVLKRRLLQLMPTDTETSCLLASSLLARQEFSEAARLLHDIVEQTPSLHSAKSELAVALYNLGAVSEAVSLFRECRVASDSIADRAEALLAAIIPGDPKAANLDILNARRAWCLREPLQPMRMSRSRRYTDKRIRIGYLSSYLDGSNWMRPVWGLINNHNRRNFHLHLYSDSASRVMDGYNGHPTDCVRYITELDNDGVAGQIQQDNLDILVDLNGYSIYSRLPLLRRRLARIGVGWFNYYATSGAQTIDYLIGDNHVIPVQEEPFYSETIMRVPGSWLTFQPLSTSPDVVDPPVSSGRPLVFGSASALFKITPYVLETWSKILHNFPDSLLYLKNRNLNSLSTREFVFRSFERFGISRRRILLEGYEEYHAFLNFYSRIDIALETFPYGGATTTTDALWQGVPVITCDGDRWAARLAKSLLVEAGLGMFVASNQEDYISLAVALGNDPQQLLYLRRRMRQQIAESSLCDVTGFTHAVETIYQEVLERVT